MKTLIQWKKTMSVYIPELDAQHKMLISLINQVYEVLKTNGDPNKLKDIITELQIYKNKHFEAEESLLKKCGYPELEAHQEMHQKMCQNIREFKNALIAGDMLPLVKLLPFLVEYLHDHIIEEDGKYARFLKQYPQQCLEP